MNLNLQDSQNILPESENVGLADDGKVYSETSAPVFSVIIISHDRKKFILDAFNSVISQEYPRDKYEIIVVKYFQDNEIDHYLKQNGAVMIQEEDPSFGAKISRGIRESSGSVISFLDDDDTWIPDKLEVVEKEFSDENLVYYHNSEVFSNDELDPLPKNEVPHEIRSMEQMGYLKIGEGSSFRKYKLTYDIFPDFNASSISVRGDFIREHSSLIGSYDTALDTLIFYICLSSGKSIVIDSRKLTIYRKHSSNISENNHASRTLFQGKKNDFDSRRWKAYGDILQFLQAKGDHKSSKLIKPLHHGLGIMSSLKAKETSRFSSLRLLMKYLLASNLEILRSRKDFLYYGIIQSISPKLGKRIFMKRHSHSG